MNKIMSIVVLILSSLFLMGASSTNSPAPYQPHTTVKQRVIDKLFRRKAVEPTVPTVDITPLLRDSLQAKVNKIIYQARNLDKNVLALGLKAHEKAKQKHVTRNDLLTIVDYSKPSTEKRFWVIDVDKEKILFHDFVAHGKNSGARIATNFSNLAGSLTSSIGVFRTSEAYNGQHGYSMRLDGLEKGVNDNARNRAIVMHGANYVSDRIASQIGRLGRSFGCLALPHHTNQAVIDTIKNGSLIFAYYPDRQWLHSSSFLS